MHKQTGIPLIFVVTRLKTKQEKRITNKSQDPCTQCITESTQRPYSRQEFCG